MQSAATRKSAYIVERYERARAVMEAHFTSRAADGALVEEADPRLVGALLAAVLDGLQLQWLLDSELPVDALVDQFLRLVLRPDTGEPDNAPTGRPGR